MTTDRINPDVHLGDQIEGFRVRKIDALPKLNNIMYQLEHESTKALMIHLSNDDDNNCFSVGLRTTPTDSSGVAHILEHTALCGSENYPVRDPFFAMIRRSMKTFMNAMTASDWTMYPFATQNETDFYNLMNVYLDAVFFPLLTGNSFKQEGHRLEFEEQENIDSKLIIQGIVYSEMMGAMSSQSHIMHRNLGQALFPTVTYKYNSGGDPGEIKTLDHQQLIDFHRQHYHPSNSLFYTYGNIGLRKHLAVINERVLSKFSQIETNTGVPNEERYTTPRSHTFYYPLSQNEDDGEKCQIALAWLTCNITDPLEVLSMQLINLILLGHSGAPLRKVLMESGLGKSLADTTGFEDEIKEPYFSVGLQAVAEVNLDEVEDLILKTLNKIVDKGISKEQIASAIHQMEFDTREISGGHYPYSLNLLFRFFGTWLHGGDPVKAIDFDLTLDRLKSKIDEGPYLENQIRRHLIDNQHKVKIKLLPDPDLAKKRNEDLERELAARKQQLTESEREGIVKTSLRLRQEQEQEEDLSSLPTLSVSDIPKGIRYVEPFQSNIDDLNIALYEQPTNGILYLSWHFNFNDINEQEREWLPVLGNILVSAGAGGLSYEQLAEQITRFTGGFSASPNVEIQVKEKENTQDYFTISSKALYRNVDKLFELTDKIIQEWDFSDLNRIKSLIALRANSLLNSIVPMGHNYASSLASRNFSPTSKIDEIYSGIHQIKFMKNLLHLNDQDLGEAVQRFNNLLNRIFRRDKVSVVAIGAEDTLNQIRPKISDFITHLGSAVNKNDASNVSKHVEPFEVKFQKEAWLTTTPVSYVAKGFKTSSFFHPDSPVLLVLANLLRSFFLHGEIREKGGAYGGMAGYNPDEGIFSMLSYRDPHLARTLSVYDEALKWLTSDSFAKQEVDETILQTCSGLDTPLSPAAKAMADYVNDRKGRTKELRERFREGVLQCTKEDLVRVGKTYLESDASLAAITSEESIKRDEANLNEWMLISNTI